ncbi:hypothetical protein EJB05_46381, partial [Eragrostis curvula]
MLVATIHGFYLKAMATFPTAERYHRGLLTGGYCYGPLDPVSNIVVNAVWHQHNFFFPMTTNNNKQVTLHVISTECLWRVASRSLYGLVSFLCTRYPRPTPDQALQRLLAAGADLRAADPNLFDPSNNIKKPNWFGCLLPEFLGSPNSVNRLKVASDTVLRDGGQLTAWLLDLLSKILLTCPCPKQREQQVPREKVSRRVRAYRAQCDATFWQLHERVCSKVNAALDAFNKDRVSKFKLHLICGVNELVSGPEYSTDPEVEAYNPWTPHKYHLCHINFLAYESSQSAKDDATAPLPNTPVAFTARMKGKGRIVHPSVESFHGRGIEFEKGLRGELFGGSDTQRYSNDNIIEEQTDVDRVHQLEDDAIYSMDDDVATDDEEEWSTDDESPGIEVC